MKLEFKNLKVETDGKVIINDLSFSVGSGEIHILMGPNGSGKSTLLNAIMGHPNNKIIGGNIKLNSKDITNMKTEEKAHSGLFLSMQYLPKIDGVTLLSFLHKSYKQITGSDIPILKFFKKMENNADNIGISKDFLSKYVNADLSGGEKKQSEILQLLALEPEFALLDEIDSGVDADSLKKVFAGIKKLADNGTGFLLVTHYSSILRYITPDVVHIIKDGEIVKSGKSELVKEIEKNGYK
jgi:Fe-S cluster assembly ATP-binding protein